MDTLQLPTFALPLHHGLDVILLATTLAGRVSTNWGELKPNLFTLTINNLTFKCSLSLVNLRHFDLQLPPLPPWWVRSAVLGLGEWYRSVVESEGR